MVQILQGNALDLLREMESESVQCIVTSPPYWGLRAYGTDPQVWQNGHELCVDGAHEWNNSSHHLHSGTTKSKINGNPERNLTEFVAHHNTCQRCGAWRGELGLEPTPELYVAHITQIFREARRVLKDDGVMFLNLADSYASFSTRNAPVYDTCGTAPQGCPLRDSIWNRPCDGCQAVSVLRNFGKDSSALSQPGGDSRDPNLENKESVRDRFPKSRSAHQKQTRQSYDATQDQTPSQDREGEPLPALRGSKNGESSQQCQGECSRLDNCACDQDGTGASSLYGHRFSDNSVSQSLKDSVSSSIQGLYENKQNKDTTGDSFVVRSSDTVYGSCPYLHSTTTYNHSQSIKPKDLIGIPWRVAFALQADGWYLRQDIIWHKPNPMPESVKDRCTKAHEYIFLMTKSARYYFDSDAILEPANYDGHKDTMMKGAKKYPNGFVPDGANPNTMHVQGHERWSRKLNGTNYAGDGSGLKTHSGSYDKETGEYLGRVGEDGIPARNKRSVWTVPTKSFRDAHFATFPEKLIEPCILAGSKPGDTILDPFNGAGTSGVVAKRFGRNYIGIELKQEYIEMAQRRIENVQTKLEV